MENLCVYACNTVLCKCNIGMRFYGLNAFCGRVYYRHKKGLDQQIYVFFLISATTHVESWISLQFFSIQGGLGLVPTT